MVCILYEVEWFLRSLFTFTPVSMRNKNCMTSKFEGYNFNDTVTSIPFPVFIRDLSKYFTHKFTWLRMSIHDG